MEWEKWLADERGNKPQSINIRRSNLVAFLEYISTKDIIYVQYYAAAKNIHCLKTVPVKTCSLTDQVLELIINMPDVHTKTGTSRHRVDGSFVCDCRQTQRGTVNTHRRPLPM